METTFDSSLRWFAVQLSHVSYEDLCKVAELGYITKSDLCDMLDRLDEAYVEQEDGWAKGYERFTRMIQKLIS